VCNNPETCKKTSEFEQGIFAELIYRTSDISQLAKWPLRFLAIFCALGSVLIWELKYDWHNYLNNKDVAFLGSFVQFTETLTVILKAGLFISFGVAATSLTFFIFSFFKNNLSKVMHEAIEVLLSNSFFFGISLVFVLLAVSNMRQAASMIKHVTIKKISCTDNLKKLGKALLFYAEQNNYHYPPPDRWCDILIKKMGVKSSDLICPGATAGNCHYAINPNAEPISQHENFKRKRELSKIVLLFETKGGWNQFGEFELLTAENHNNEGANVLFNNGRVNFVEKDRFSKLKWKVKERNIGREDFSK